MIYRIEIDEALESLPTFRDFVLVHEFMHYIDYSHNFKRRNDNMRVLIQSFFDLKEDTEIFIELYEELGSLIDDKFGIVKVEYGSQFESKTWNFSHGNDLSSEELIANFGASIYLWPDSVKLTLPSTSSRFVDLLNQGYYGEDAKKIFKHLVIT